MTSKVQFWDRFRRNGSKRKQAGVYRQIMNYITVQPYHDNALRKGKTPAICTIDQPCISVPMSLVLVAFSIASFQPEVHKSEVVVRTYLV